MAIETNAPKAVRLVGHSSAFLAALSSLRWRRAQLTALAKGAISLECPLDVDSSLPECANSGHCVTARRTGQIDRGCVKTSSRFHTSLFRSLLRGLRAFRVEKIAKNLALLDRLQNVAEFLHGLDPKRKFQVYERICGVRRKADLADRLAASYRRLCARSRGPTPGSLTAPALL
jgi:hypothetical protein